jgi:hypothetical protein
MLDSPAGALSSHQELSDNNTGPHTNKRPDSVSSLVSNLKITAFQGVPVLLDKKTETPARIQSDPGAVIKLIPKESLDLNRESAEEKPADSDSGSVTGTGSGSGTRVKSNSVGAGVDTVTGRQIGTGIKNDTGTKAKIGNQSFNNRKRLLSDVSMASGAGSPRRPGSAFPPDYLNVRKQREMANPFVELTTVDGNRRKQARSIKPLPGFDLPDDERQYAVSNYHVPSLKKM